MPREGSKVVKFSLEHEYIELARLLKATGVCESGGTAKVAITDGRVRVDGAVELRRGRKIRQGQKVEFEGTAIEVKEGRKTSEASPDSRAAGYSKRQMKAEATPCGGGTSFSVLLQPDSAACHRIFAGPEGARKNTMDTGMEPKSKSQAKRDMLALQSLGERLLGLSAEQIKKIEMPPELQDALLFAGTIKRGEARRRQLQYIGALMREVDPGPIQKALDHILSGQAQDMEHFKELERWRDELAGGNDAIMDEILGRFPSANLKMLRRLTLNARKDREGNRTPKASRALFRFLKGLQGL